MAKGLRQLLESLLVKEGYTRQERLEILDHTNYPTIRDNLFELLCLLMRKAKQQGKPLADHILMEISIAAGHVYSSSPSGLDSDVTSKSQSPDYSTCSSGLCDKLPMSRDKIVGLKKHLQTNSQSPCSRDVSTQTGINEGASPHVPDELDEYYNM